MYYNKENHRYLHVCMYRATCLWALVLALVLLGMAGPTRAQPVDIPATWGGDVWSHLRVLKAFCPSATPRPLML
jgi:hypothetical protein